MKTRDFEEDSIELMVKEREIGRPKEQTHLQQTHQYGVKRKTKVSKFMRCITISGLFLLIIILTGWQIFCNILNIKSFKTTKNIDFQTNKSSMNHQSKISLFIDLSSILLSLYNSFLILRFYYLVWRISPGTPNPELMTPENLKKLKKRSKTLFRDINKVKDAIDNFHMSEKILVDMGYDFGTDKITVRRLRKAYTEM